MQSHQKLLLSQFKWQISWFQYFCFTLLNVFEIKFVRVQSKKKNLMETISEHSLATCPIETLNFDPCGPRPMAWPVHPPPTHTTFATLQLRWPSPQMMSRCDAMVIVTGCVRVGDKDVSVMEIINVKATPPNTQSHKDHIIQDFVISAKSPPESHCGCTFLLRLCHNNFYFSNLIHI